MAVIVEDGTIIADANSYATVGTADNYHENMGNTAWADLDDETKEASLVRGTLMLESRFRGRWVGYKTNNKDGTVQRLAWPRKADKDQTSGTLTAIKDIDGIEIGVNAIPQEVQYACMEAAFMQAIGQSLIPDSVDRSAYVKSSKVDVIAQEFFENAPAINRFPLIDQLLQNLAAVGDVSLSMVIGITEEERVSFEGGDATTRWLNTLNNNG